MKQLYWLVIIICCILASPLATPAQIVGVAESDLGLVVSVQYLLNLMGVKTGFDNNKDAVVSNAEREEPPSQTTPVTELAVQSELPHIHAPDEALMAIEQRVNVSGSNDQSLASNRDLTVVGSFLGGSLLLRADQPSLRQQPTWTLAEVQFQRYSHRADYIVGSQPVFWHSRGIGNYWGFTTIQREGFKPLMQNSQSDPRQRLQAAEIGKTLAPGQIPIGATALIFSGGWRQEPSESEGFLSDFSDFLAGIAQRLGVSEDLTVGIGGVYDQSLRGLGELFFRPQNFPLEVVVSALTGSRWDVNANIRFNPFPTFNISLKSDHRASLFQLDWQLFHGFTLLGTYDSRHAAAIGGELSLNGRNASTLGSFTIDNQNHFRWKFQQRLGRLELKQEGNEIKTLSSLTYNFSHIRFKSKHSLVINYETSNEQKDSHKLATLAWRYHSPEQATDGNYLWQAQLGYGMGSVGSGLVASLQTTLIPGLLLVASYQGVSVTSDEATFSIKLVPSVNLQPGITSGDRNSNYLRTQGGLLVESFYDRNNDGKRDADEDLYTEPKLVLLDRQPIQSFQPEVRGGKTLVRLPPSTYRLDFDRANFPPGWQPSVNAYAVDVAAGSHTLVLVPLVRSYILTDLLTDEQNLFQALNWQQP